MPKNGLLVGGGGGWSNRYTDYVLHIDGTIEKLEYETGDGPIPDDYVITATKVGAANDVVDFVGKLTANGFWTQASDKNFSSAVEYIVAVNEKKGAHTVVWSVDASNYPEPIWSIRKDILDYAKKIAGG